MADEDNGKLLRKFRDRMDKVGIELPRIEVRFQNLTIEADAYVGNRALPTLFNFGLNIVEGFLSRIHLLPETKRKLTVLNNVSGIVKPSRMTLLLGPPASGKTTLLLALAGKLDTELRVSGQVTYNGHNISEFVPQRTCAYISQQDTHIGEMTVRETLDFSRRCQGVGTRHDMLIELSRREKEAGIKPDPDLDILMKAFSMEGQETSILTDYVMKILDLSICADTLVGNEMLRGISGGQKKRMTTGEMLVGPANALFMDEISTGLDSSTTYKIIKCLCQYVQLLDVTMVVSLLQPAPETFELFDDVILLCEGETVYQGPRELILDFFEGMGFKCPDRKNVADFLQEVTSRKDQEQYWRDKSQPYRYIPVKEFTEAFGSFHVGQGIQEDLSVPFEKSRSHPAALSSQKYGLNKWEVFKACFWREQLLMKRNSFLYIFKTVQISIVSVITMTVFFHTKLHPGNITDRNLYLGALFFGLINVMFNGLAEMTMSASRLPVFYKQRDQMFHPAWAVSIPTMITRLPLSILESGIWVSLTYYTIGFAPEAGRFFRQFVLLFWLSQMAYGFFRFIGAVGRSMVVANTFGSFALMVTFVLGGFILSKDDIHKWWIWGYWISPMMYGQEAMAVNEFLAPRWDLSYNDTTKSASTVGKAVLKELGISTHGYWYWIGVGALVGYTVLFNVLCTLALAYLNPLNQSWAIIPMEDFEGKCLIQRRQASHLPQSRPKRRSIYAQRLREEGSDRFDVENGAAVKASGKGMVLPFRPMSIAFHNINYYVDMPAEMRQQRATEDKLQLLQNVSGAFRPGILTALVGVSGAGKTTLMDVLAGRKTGGYIEGDINISGYPKKQETFARIAGYCEQTDIHSPNVTVKESLIYSAWLRLPKEVDKHTRMMFVDEVMALVELTSIQDTIVGLPGVSGLSAKQRKRLTIAVELVVNPSIIFMDEPTSGLDARAAAIVMRTIRNTVDTGRTVVCTIHQPSIEIFEAFDELLLLNRAGRVIYDGTLGRHSHKLVEYFEAITGIPKIKEGHNPATWMLEISSVGVETRLGIDFGQIYEDSSLFQHNEALIKELSTPAPGSKELHFQTRYSKSFAVQFMACLWKQHLSYWRNPHYNGARLLFTTMSTVLCGTVFWSIGSRISKQRDIANIMGAMHAATIFLGVTNANMVQPVVDVERAFFYREKAAGMYSALAYALAQEVVEIPYVLLQTFIYGFTAYFMMSFQRTAVKLFWFLFFTFCTFLYFTYCGMMVVAMTPDHAYAAIISSALFGLWNLFSGFMIPRTRIPIWWRWYCWANPASWTLYGLITSQLGDLDGVRIDVPGSGNETVTEYLRENLGFRYDFLGVVAGVNVGLIVLFATVYAFCIKFINFQKR